MRESLECPHCKSKSVIKWCKRKTLNRGLIQRYKCKDCKKCFTVDDGFFRMRNSPQKITLCIDLFFRGISTRKVQEHLQAFYPENSSWVSIYNWVIKYSKHISKYTDKLKIKAGWEVQIDEVEFHRRKHPKKHLGVAKNWFIDSIDTKTRFLVASDYVESRSAEEIKKIMLQIKDNANWSTAP